MSAQRILTPLAMPSSFVFKFASLPTSSSLRPCQHILRSFSSSPSCRASNKRKMQTTSYTPYALASELPPPPRNAGIPDTSIAGAIPQLNETRPPKQAQQAEISAEPSATISITEQEAQRPQTTTVPSEQARPKPRTKLRARKAAMKLTPAAVTQLRELLNQPQPKLIKVGVVAKGCSGQAYNLEYVEKPGMFDEQVEQDGVKVLIDSKALLTIIGSEMDYVEDKLNQRFVFHNPNIKEQCGCGESFTTG